MEKKELRRRVKAQLAGITSQQRSNLSQALLEQITASPLWDSSKDIFIFCSMPDEIDTAPIIRAAQRSGKRIWLPKIIDDILQIREYREDAVASGKWKILEPTEEAPLLQDYTIPMLAIIPGVAFTREGARLGRGKSFYDRLLPQLTNATLAGVCYPCQIVESIPTDPWDINMQHIFCGE